MADKAKKEKKEVQDSKSGNPQTKKVIRFRNRPRFNLWPVAFVLVSIYVLYNIYQYFASYNVAEYEVQQGVIASNNTYKGLIIRDETIVYADHDGYINYYVKNGTKISATDVIYSIDTDGKISAQITAAASTDDGLDSEELSNILEGIDKFQNSYSSVNYQNVYAYKADLASELNQSLSKSALSSLSASTAGKSLSSSFYQETAGSSGIITYYIDGKESLTTNNYEEDDLVSSNYSRTTLDENTEVKSGDPVYKLINNENWNIIVPITSVTYEAFAEISSVTVRFTKDDISLPASCTTERKEGNYYLILSLRSGVIRYIGDRYEEIELITGNNQGLKIPMSAIVTKDLFKVSADYFKGNTPYLCIRQNSNTIREVTPTIYYYADGYYYISDDAVSSGDVVVSDDTLETYEIGTDVETLKGVYELNKGYAVFRPIEIATQNDDYAIVKTGTNRGISLYDHIALDGSKVSESQTVIR